MSKLDQENGLKLKGFRKQNGYSQAYIGELVGKCQRTVSGYEMGVSPMPNDVISLLNKKYNLKLKSKHIKTTKVKTTAKTIKEEGIAKCLESVINTLHQVLNWVRHG